MTGEENYLDHAQQVGEGLTGLTLEQLGFEPRLEDLTQDQRSRLDADDLAWAASITPARRDRSLRPVNGEIPEVLQWLSGTEV